MLAGALRQPIDIRLHIVPADVDDGAIVPAPSRVVGAVAAAAPGRHAGVPFRKRHLVGTRPEGRNRDHVLRSLVVVTPRLGFRRTHRERACRNPHHQRALGAVADANRHCDGLRPRVAVRVARRHRHRRRALRHRHQRQHVARHARSHQVRVAGPDFVRQRLLVHERFREIKRCVLPKGQGWIRQRCARRRCAYRRGRRSAARKRPPRDVAGQRRRAGCGHAPAVQGVVVPTSVGAPRQHIGPAIAVHVADADNSGGRIGGQVHRAVAGAHRAAVHRMEAPAPVLVA